VRIGLQLLLGFFLMIGLATFFVMRVFVAEVKPGVRQAMESTLVDAANVLAAMAAEDLKAGEMATGAFTRNWEEARRRELGAKVWQFTKQQIAFRISITDDRGIVVYDSEGKDVGRDNSRWRDVYSTLRGQYGARSSPEVPGDRTRTVMHVAAPIYDPAAAGRVLGVLTLSQSNSTFEPFIEASRDDIVRRGSWLIGLSIAIALVMTAWFLTGIHRLRRYAQAVSAGLPVAPPPRRRDELGDLGAALQTMREKLDGKAYVEEYVQSLTHELKGPLAAIRGAAELLDEPLPEEDRRRFAQHIRAQEERLTETIDKLLLLAEVEQHGWLRKQEPIELVALIAHAVEDCAAKLAAADLTLEVKRPDEETAANADPAKRPSLRGDPYLLRQALANLLDNAIAFSPRGATITLVVEVTGDQLLLAVRDQGPGVPDYAQGRVFERFYSLPRPGSGRKSSGLGLPFVRQVARLHGGTVELSNRTEARAEAGAEARLRLPLS
jgi:two-component system, OmpR family, sensor histidine kinase CreC